MRVWIQTGKKHWTCVCLYFYFMRVVHVHSWKSADPASPWPRQGGAWDHRRCGTLLSLKATVNRTTASDLLWASKTDGCIAPPSNPSSSAAGFSMVSAGTPSGFMGFRLAPCLVIWDFGWPSVWLYGISKLTDGPLSRSQTPPHAQELLGLSCGGL